MQQHLSAQPKSSSALPLGRSLATGRSQLISEKADRSIRSADRLQSTPRDEGFSSQPMPPWGRMLSNLKSSAEQSPVTHAAPPAIATSGHSFATLALHSHGGARPDQPPPAWLQPKWGTVRRKAVEPAATPPKSKNKTGLPDSLKAGIERLSGLAMDDVQVHYNSSEPPKLQAYAYTEGTHIHVAAGQEQHLPHEAWHVVQQKQGRVQPAVQLKGIKANVDFWLEKEATIMGAKAQDVGDMVSRLPAKSQVEQSSQLLGQSTQTLQRTTGTPVRQFGNGGTVQQNTRGVDETTVEREKLVTDGLVTSGEIFDVEVARAFVKNKVKSDVIQTVTRHVRQYYISDTDHYFYTATSDEAAASILEHGLDPNFGGKREPDSITGWNSRGHVYFTLEPSTARGYGKNVIQPKTGSYTLLRFTLPLRHPVTLDPELGPQSSALRTNVLIPASNIERV